MTQLIVSLDDNVPAASIKRAISMLRGVVDVKKYKSKAASETMKAIEEMRNGDTIVCKNFDEYLKLVEKL